MNIVARHRRIIPAPALALALACGCGGVAPASGTQDSGSDSGSVLIILPRDAGRDSRRDTMSDVASSDAADASRQPPLPSLTVVPLVGCDVSEYNATVTLGGSQPFQMAIDTGSTTLGVASTMCPSCSVVPAYTPDASAVDQNMTGTSQYGSGSWSGEIYQDTVRVGSGPTVPDKFVAIDTQSQFFQPGIRCGSSGGPQGILGLGPSQSALPGTQGFFDQLVASAKVPDVFATELCDTTGTLWLGGYDPLAMSAAPQYTPLAPSFLSQYYYAVALVAITVEATTVPVGSAQYPDSVVDTGTSIVILPTDAFTAITRAIGANARFKEIFGFGGASSVDASRPDGAPADASHGDAGERDARGPDARALDAGIVDGSAADAGSGAVNGASWFSSIQNCVRLTQTKAELDAMLPGMTLVFGSSPSISVEAVATESYLVPYQDYWCPALYSMAPGPSFPLASILGSPILRSNVVIFDRANQRIGFAPHTPCP